MKKTVIILIALLIVLPTIFVNAQKKPKIEEKMIVIQGDEGWKNTGIRISPKDKVTIKASGTVYFSDANKLSNVTPDGINLDYYEADWPLDYLECDDPMPQTNHAALIGNLGNEDFFIGNEISFNAKEGILYLGINDCTLKRQFYNTGQFEVYIKVEHPK